MRKKNALAALAASTILVLILVLLIGAISAAQETPQKAPQEKDGMIEPTRSLEGGQEEKGKLAVFSEPPNLEVKLDGEKIGETPVAVEVGPGEHQLSVEDAEQTIIVLPGESIRMSLFKGEFIKIPEEEERTVAEAPEPPKRAPRKQQEEARVEKERRDQNYHFYWPLNPRGPVFTTNDD